MNLKDSSTTAPTPGSRHRSLRNHAIARTSLVVGTCAGILLIALATLESAEIESDERVARGRHLVHEVAMCIDCHSPRGKDGRFQADQHLTGSAVGFAPIVPMPAWAPTAPPLKGLPGYTDEQATHFLMTGERPNGQPARPPMPPYRFTRDEAQAVVAYLRALPQGRQSRKERSLRKSALMKTLAAAGQALPPGERRFQSLPPFHGPVVRGRQIVPPGRCSVSRRRSSPRHQ